MSQPLENESLLEDALSEAFSPPPSRRQSKIVPSGDTAPTTAPMEGSPNAADEAATDTWKIEYEQQVAAWREQSALAREKAEQERAKWEAIREEERKQGGQPAPLPDAPWEKTAVVVPPSSSSPSPADSRDLVTGEPSKTVPHPPTSSHSKQETVEDSQKWENVPSEVTSSFPSMSFPDSREDSYPDSKPSHPPHPPVSTTLSVFGSSLSTRTRVKAFASSLAINLLLPFVNGVMLGFGELFAKNVVLEWLGWRNTAPRYTPSSLGLRGSRR